MSQPPIRINENKLRQVIPHFQPGQQSGEGPPWVAPATVAGLPLFPLENDAVALDFFLLLGALNYSYWIRDGSEVSTWGGRVNGEPVEDVFALCFCIQRARDRGLLRLEADCYCEMDRSTVTEIFTFGGGETIPMVETRLRKIRELGQGLQRFASISGDEPTFSALLGSYRTFPAVLDAMEKFFPYSFGDPYRKLSQLSLKMIMDRTPSADEADDRFQTERTWREATRFLSGERLRAQPDYMLPLFCLKTGLWEIDDQLEQIVEESRELPMDHPLERAIRDATMETVDRIADEWETEPGVSPHGHVDSVMWQTAVQGCFPVDCQGCMFYEKCDAVQQNNQRLDWDHHLTRTIHY